MRTQHENSTFNISITYKSVSKVFKILNSKQNLKVIMENIKKIARENPSVYWTLPEIDVDGKRITYLLGRSDDKNDIFHETNDDGDLLSLEDYNVKHGDNLVIIKKVVAG